MGNDSSKPPTASHTRLWNAALHVANAGRNPKPNPEAARGAGPRDRACDRVVARQRIDERGDPAGHDPIVGIAQQHEIRGCCRDPRIARVRRPSTACGAHDLQPRDAVTPPHDALDGVVARAVVDDDHLPVAVIRLLGERLQLLVDHRTRVARGNDDGRGRHPECGNGSEWAGCSARPSRRRCTFPATASGHDVSRAPAVTLPGAADRATSSDAKGSSLTTRGSTP